MTVNIIEEAEILEYTIPFTLVFVPETLNSTVVREMSAAGHHPKCRIVRGMLVTLVSS